MYTRPLVLRFEKEDSSNTNKEYNTLIKALKEDLKFNFCVQSKNIKFILNNEMKFTMVDQKTINYLTNNTASTRCYICKKTFKDFKDDFPGTFDHKADKNVLNFGISPLHASIRAMEFCTKLAINCNCKNKEEKLEFKIKYQQLFLEKLRIKVDIPKQGYGNSNCGNTSKIFFDNHQISADILKINEQLVYKLGLIIKNISSKKTDYCIKDHNELCHDVFIILRSKYNDQQYSPTVHKLVAHSTQIIQAVGNPGILSEQSQEHANKIIRNLRSTRARKTDRKSNIEDIFTTMWAYSSPFLRELD